MLRSDPIHYDTHVYDLRLDLAYEGKTLEDLGTTWGQLEKIRLEGLKLKAKNLYDFLQKNFTVLNQKERSGYAADIRVALTQAGETVKFLETTEETINFFARGRFST